MIPVQFPDQESAPQLKVDKFQKQIFLVSFAPITKEIGLLIPVLTSKIVESKNEGTLLYY